MNSKSLSHMRWKCQHHLIHWILQKELFQRMEKLFCLLLILIQENIGEK